MSEIQLNGDYVIQAQGLVKRFGEFTAVAGIDFKVRRGEIFGFLGPNGSGKTTTIRMMLGLLRPSEGEVDVLGVQITKNPSKIRPHIGYMSQRFSLYNDLTVMQNLLFYGRVYGLKNAALHERIGGAIKMAGLEGHENTPTKDLSGGWRQRLALGAAILHRPQIVFLDEPTAGVDPLSRRAFWDLLYNLIGEGITVFVTTHYMDEAEHCHRLAFIQHGKIIAYGSPEGIKKEKMRGQVLEITSDNAPGVLKTLKDADWGGTQPLDDVALYGSLVHVVAPDVKGRIAKIGERLEQAGILVQDMAVIEPSLEDVFIACMR